MLTCLWTSDDALVDPAADWSWNIGGNVDELRTCKWIMSAKLQFHLKHLKLWSDFNSLTREPKLQLIPFESFSFVFVIFWKVRSEFETVPRETGMTHKNWSHGWRPEIRSFLRPCEKTYKLNNLIFDKKST